MTGQFSRVVAVGSGRHLRNVISRIVVFRTIEVMLRQESQEIADVSVVDTAPFR